MQVTLIHNPKAGDGDTDKKELVSAFEQAGHEVSYQSAKDRNFPRALDKPGEVVVVAGGDGTVGKVARRILGRNVPLAVLPLGTANNIGNALGAERTPREFAQGLAKSPAIKFDVGMARGPWGDLPFLEGAGAGLFPRMMFEHESNRAKGASDPVDLHGGLLGGVRFLQTVLDRLRGQKFVAKLDSLELAGNYLLLEVMNIRTIGPALELAPDADPGDGFLDVVVVRQEEREELKQHLASHFAKGELPAFQVHRTRHVHLSGAAAEFHFDDKIWPTDEEGKPDRRRAPKRDLQIEFEVLPGALRIMVPGNGGKDL
jgi:diacylglycerol kinase (ATP)